VEALERGVEMVDEHDPERATLYRCLLKAPSRSQNPELWRRA
jgi:hypothetical protein